LGAGTTILGRPPSKVPYAGGIGLASLRNLSGHLSHFSYASDKHFDIFVRELPRFAGQTLHALGDGFLSVRIGVNQG
jgi:hypothetical protein